MEKNNIGKFQVSGLLGKAELEQVQNQCEAAIQKVGNIRILIIVNDFQGWEKTGGWEDLSFPERNDRYIDKFAIVGDDKWMDLAFFVWIRNLIRKP